MSKMSLIEHLELKSEGENYRLAQMAVRMIRWLTKLYRRNFVLLYKDVDQSCSMIVHYEQMSSSRHLYNRKPVIKRASEYL